MIFTGHPRAESEAIFGSAARYSTDGLSDRDILIVGNDPAVLRRRSQLLKSHGWSVAAYSWSRLATLARIKGLFVQHLKLEALIIRDKNDRLRCLLDRFESAVDYSQEASETCEVIARSTSGIQTAEERFWAMDVLALTVRNLGILKLASTGRYNFDYHTVVREAFYDRGLSDEDVEVLLKLRDAKFLYRAGLPNPMFLVKKSRERVRSLVRRHGHTIQISSFGRRSENGGAKLDHGSAAVLAVRAA